MALKDTDLLAVYRATGETAGNYSASVADIVARVPSTATPSLTSVLQENNISQNFAIQIDDSTDAPVIFLSPGTSSDSYFVNHVRFDEGLKIGSATEAKFKKDGKLIGPNVSLIGEPSSNVALEIFPAGTTINEVSSGEAAAVVVTISNSGVASFAGALDAASIDGGEYA